MPSVDYLYVGKATQIGYFDPQEMSERIHVTKERPRLLAPAMDETVLAPGELVYGVYDFHASAPVRVSVIMYGADVDPFAFLRTAHVLPRDEIALRGTFRGMNRIVTSGKVYYPARDGAVYFPIGDNVHDTYRSGVDATDGTAVVNYGNYGILYQINIPTAGRVQTRYFLSPLGGVYAGAIRAVSGTKKRLVETPSLRPYFGDQTRPESAQAAQARAEGPSLGERILARGGAAAAYRVHGARRSRHIFERSVRAVRVLAARRIQLAGEHHPHAGRSEIIFYLGRFFLIYVELK